MKKHLALLIAALLCACCMGLAACGGGSAASSGAAASSGSGSAVSANATNTAAVTSGTWQCTGVVSEADGKTYELGDVMNARVMSIHFFGENEVRVYVDTNFTIMQWTLDGNDLTFSGEGTYHLTVQDNGEKLVWENFQDTGYNLEFEKEE